MTVIPVLEHNVGFEMEMHYDFDRNRSANQNPPNPKNPDNNFGYVVAPSSNQTVPGANPTEYRRKLSYVANSGIKFGGTAGASTRIVEINILDVEKMSDMADLPTTLNGQTAFVVNPVTQNTDRPQVELPGWLKVPNPPQNPPIPIQYTHFAIDESLNTLMHGVGYGGEYSQMADYASNTNNTVPQTWQRYHQTLLNNKARSQGSNTMTIKLVGANLSVYLNQDLTDPPCYSDTENPFIEVDPPPSNRPPKNGHLYLQSHWGSGVIFKKITFK